MWYVMESSTRSNYVPFQQLNAVCGQLQDEESAIAHEAEIGGCGYRDAIVEEG
jgi:hypothetical protein